MVVADDLYFGVGLAIVASVIASFIASRNESFYAIVKEKFGKSLNRVTDDSQGKLIDIKFPYQLQVGSFTTISATFHGTVRRGFLSCQIVDCFGKYNWCEAKSTVKQLDHKRQTGNLNFTNKKRTITWPIKPEPFLTKGKGKLVIGVFEERDTVENNDIIENHPHVALEEREVLLF